MSDEKKNTLWTTLAEPIANSAKNITDKPTQNIGTTLADIWYLVFGGISHTADKRKLKYSYALQKMENELKDNITKIPENKLIEPDIQIVAQALEAAKYCVEKEELRHMFVKLISNSLNEEYSKDVHPIYINIIKSLTPFDAKLLLSLYNHNFIFDFNFEDIIYSINILSQLGLVSYEHKYYETNSSTFIEQETVGNEHVLRFNFDMPIDEIPNVIFTDKEGNKLDSLSSTYYSDLKKIIEDMFMNKLHITKLGYSFIRTCL